MKRDLSKFQLPPPPEKEKLNDRIGHAEYYPPSRHPGLVEEALDEKVVAEGHSEPAYSSISVRYFIVIYDHCSNTSLRMNTLVHGYELVPPTLLTLKHNYYKV